MDKRFLLLYVLLYLNQHLVKETYKQIADQI